MQKILLLSVTFLVTSCSGIPQIPRLELPPKVDCHKPKDAELNSVSDKVYNNLANLYITCVENDKTLRDIIRSTHK